MVIRNGLVLIDKIRRGSADGPTSRAIDQYVTVLNLQAGYGIRFGVAVSFQGDLIFLNMFGIENRKTMFGIDWLLASLAEDQERTERRKLHTLWQIGFQIIEGRVVVLGIKASRQLQLTKPRRIAHWFVKTQLIQPQLGVEELLGLGVC